MAEQGPVGVDVTMVKSSLKAMVSTPMAGTMAVVAEGLVADVNDLWMSAGNGTWQKLAESTKKKRRGTTYQLLQDTGVAIGSVQAFSGEAFAEAASNVDYLKYHCGDLPRTIIPKRDPFELDDAALERAMNVITDAIVAGKQ